MIDICFFYTVSQLVSKRNLPSKRSANGYKTLVKSLTLRLLMSYIYGAPILDVSRSHTTTQHSR